ncbi:MAG: PKD domain-containing protein [Bacteroidia bacterium]|nr:PKD domain-containing protein [Bacteroidia bacterium]
MNSLYKMKKFWNFTILILIPYLLGAHSLPEPSINYRFTENKGQWPAVVKFRADLPQGKLFLEANRLTYLFLDIENSNFPKHHGTSETHGNILSLPTNLNMPSGQIKAHAYRVHFLESNPNSYLNKTLASPDYSNYFYGDGYTASEVYSYHKITYQNLYSGVDLAFYNQGSQIKYDFILQRAKDIHQIQLYYEGAERIFVREGKLIIQTSINEVIEEIPKAYQKTPQGNQSVECVFQMIGPATVGFKLQGNYNPEFPLVIDPVLVFSTYTGSFADNWGYTATYDEAGALYSGGIVHDVGYPVSPGALQINFGGKMQGNYPQSLWYGSDIALIKYNSTGTNRIWATYLGGSFNEQPHSLIVNSNNELFVLGATRSFNFPVTQGCFDATYNGNIDMIVARISANGTALLASTYIGGSMDDGINQHPSSGNPLYKFYADDARGEIILTPQGEPVIISSTASSNFPVTPGVIQNFLKGQQDAVFLRLTPNLSNLLFSTYLGGNLFDAGYSVRQLSNGDYYIVGGTNSSTGFLATPGTWQPFYQGGVADGFILRVNSAGTAVIQGTYVGTNSYDQVFMIDFDDNNNLYIVGQTEGPYPIINAPYFVPNAGQFITKISPNLNNIIYSTRFGTGNGKPDITISAFMVDKCQNVYVSGWGGLHDSGNTTGLPVTPNAFKPITDGSDFYLCVFNKDMVSLQYATFFGGNISEEHVDGGTSRFDKNGIVYQSVCAGCGGNNDFPTTPGAWSATNNASNCNNGTFKFQFDSPNAVYANFASVPPGCAPYTVTFNNTSTGAISYQWNFGAGIPSSNQANPTVTFSAPGTYTVTLKAINPGKCNQEDSIKRVITVTAAPTFSVQPSSGSVCVGQTINLSFNGTPLANGTYQWNFNGATPATASTIGPHTVSWNSAGVKTIVLNVAANGCSSTQTVLVTVLPNPAPPTAPTVSRCGAGQITLTASAQPPLPEQILFFETPNATTPLATINQPPYTYTTPNLTTTTSYYVEARNGNCRSTRVAVSATIHPITSPPLTQDVARCGAGNVTITSSVTNAQAVRLYTEANSTNPIQTSTTSPYAFTPFITTTTTYFLDANNSFNCPSPKVPVVVTIHPLPATPILQNLSQCGATLFTFTVSNSYPTNTQLEVFSNNCTANPVTTISVQPFTFTTGLITTTTTFFFQIIDSQTGCRSNCTNATATIFPIPAQPSAAPISACAGLTVSFTAQFGTPPGAVIRLFTQPNATTPISTVTSSNTPFVVGPLQQTTTFYLEAATQNCSSARSSVVVEVLANPTPPVVENISRCGTGSVTLTATQVAPNTERIELYWQPTGGTAIASASAPPFELNTPNINNTTTFFVEAINTAGCRSSRTAVTVTISPVPNLITLPSRQSCGPSPIDITLPFNFPGATQIEFFGGSCSSMPLATANTPGESVSLGNVTTSTTFYYQLTHLPTNCKSGCGNFSVTIHPIPSAPTAEAATVCQGQISRITAQMGPIPGNAISLYTQELATQPIASDNTPPYEFSFQLAPGTYTYYLEVNLNSCPSSRTSVVHVVHPKPTPPQVPNHSRCGAGIITLTATLANLGGNTWIQLFESANAAQPTLSANTSPHEFTVNISATTTFWFAAFQEASGCVSDRVPVVASVLPLPALPGPFSVSRCGAGNITLTVNNGTPPFTQIRIFSQTTGGNPIFTAQSPNFQLQLTSQFTTYWLETFNAQTGCTNGRTPITINELPIPPAPVVANIERCLAGQVTFSISFFTANTKIYLYTNSAATQPIDSTQNTLLSRTVTTTTTFYWQALDPITGCRSEVSSSSVTIHSRPSTPITAPVTTCQGVPYTIEITNSYPFNTKLNLYDASQNLLGSSEQAPYRFERAGINTNTTFYLEAINLATGCTSLLGSSVVTVISSPLPPSAPNVSRCGSGQITLTLQSPTPNTIVHIYSAEIPTQTPIQTLNQSPYTFSASITTTVTYSAITELQPWGCKSTPTTFSLVVLPNPAAPTVPNVARCNAGPVTFTVTANEAEAQEIHLYVSPTAPSSIQIQTLPNNTLTTPFLNTHTTFYIGVRNTQTGCSSPRTAAVAVIYSTGIPNAPNLVRCGPGIITFTAVQGDPAGDRILLWNGPELIVSSGAPYVFTLAHVQTTTTFFLQSYNTATGCSSSLRSLPVTILPLPAPPTANTPLSCGPSSLTFNFQVGTPEADIIRIFPDVQQNTFLEINAPYNYTTPLITQTTTFYATAYNSQTGCQSTPIPIEAIITPIPSPPTAPNLSRCGAGILNFSINANNPEPTAIEIYQEGSSLLLGTSQTSPHTFSLNLQQTTQLRAIAVNPQTGCKSQGTIIEATIHPVPGTPIATTQTACGNTHVTLSITSGTPSSNQIRIEDSNSNLLQLIDLPAQSIQLPYQENSSYKLIAINTTTGCQSLPLWINPQPNPPPPAPAPITLGRCGSGNVSFTLSNSNNLHYAIYSIATGGQPLYSLFTNTGVLENISQNTTFYIEAIDPQTLCISPRSPIQVNIFPIPAEPTPQTISRCGSGSFILSGTLEQNNLEVYIYESLQSNTPLPTLKQGNQWVFETPTLNTSTRFFIAHQNTQSGCQSLRAPLDLHILPIPAAPIPNTPSRCGPGSLQFTIQGEQTIELYAENGTLINRVSQPPYRLSTPFTQSTTTYFIQSINPITQCSSNKVPAVAIIHPIPSAPNVSNLVRCGPGQISFSLGAQSTDITSANLWGSNNENQLLQTTSTPFHFSWQVTTSAQYWISVQTPHCHSPKTPFYVTVHPLPSSPTAPSITLCAEAGVLPITFTVTAENAIEGINQINLYTSSLAQEPLVTRSQAPYLLQTIASTGATTTFYLENQNINTGCKSPRIAVTATLNANPILPVISTITRCGEGIVEMNIPLHKVYEYRLFNDAAATQLIARGVGATLQFRTTLLSQSQYLYFQLRDIATGCQSSVVPIWIEILPVPPAPRLSFPQSLCAGEDLKVVAPPIPGIEYLWQGPAGLSFRGNELFIPNITTAHQGVYTIRTINAAGCTSEIALHRLRIIETAQIIPEPGFYNIFGQDRPFCVGQEINLYVKNFASFPDGTQFEWRGPHGFYSFPHPFPGVPRPIGLHNAGTYQVRAVLGSCATDWASIDIQIYDKPRKPQIFSNAPLCPNDSALVLHAHAPGAVEYYWIGPGAFTARTPSSELRRQAIRENSGVYSVVAVNAYGCFSDTATLEVNISSPTVNLLLNYPSSICQGEAVLFQILNPVPGARYTLLGPDGFEAHLQQEYSREYSILRANANFSFAGVYTLTATIGNCTLPPAFFPLRVFPKPAPPNIRGQLHICQGQTAQLFAGHASTQASIIWRFHNSTFEGNTLLLTPSQLQGANEHTISAYAVEQNCTSEWATTTLQIINTPLQPVVNSQFAICQGQKISLDLPSLGAQGYYLWLAQGQPAVRLSEPFIVEPSVSGIYSIVAVVESCSSIPTKVEINVQPIPSKPIIQSIGTFCLGSNLILRAIGQQGSSFIWNGPLLNNRVGQQISINNLNLYHNGTYSVVASQNGCTSEVATFSLEVRQVIIENIFSNAPLCSGQNLLLTAFANPLNAQYLWQGPENFHHQTTSSHILRSNVTSAQAGVYSVVAIAQGCTSLAKTIRVEVKPLPPLPTIISSPSRCEGDTLFLSVVSQRNERFQWFFPDGNTQEGSSVMYRLNPLSNGVIKLRVEENGCFQETSLPISVVRIPATPTLEAVAPICEGQRIRLGVKDDNPQTSYFWQGPQNLSWQGQELVLTSTKLSHSGQYFVYAIEQGCTSSAATLNLIVNPVPTLELLSANSPLCPGQTLNLQTNPIPNATYLWKPPSGQIINTLAPSLSIPNVTQQESGSYSVWAVVNGCTSQPQQTFVQVNMPLQSIQALVSGPHCSGETLTLTALGPTSYQYTWSGPGGFSQTGQTIIIPNISTSQGGIYEVWASAAGCTTSPAQVVVTVSALPTTPLVFSNAPICSGQTLTLSTPTIPGATYLWQGPAAGNPRGFQSTQQNPQRQNIQPSDAGIYTLTVRLGSCTASTTFRVEIQPTPRLPTVSNNGPVCEGQTLHLQTSFIPGASYLWQGPNNFVSTQNSPTIPNVNTNHAGAYSLAIIQGGCTSAQALTLARIIPSPTTFIADTMRACGGSSITLFGPSIPGVTYQWLGPAGFSSTLAAPTITNISIRNQGEYRLFIQQENCRFFVKQTRIEVQNCKEFGGFLEPQNTMIYPNPNKGSFYLILSSSMQQELRSAYLLNVKGQKITQFDIELWRKQPIIFIEITTKEAGMYFLQLEFEEKLVSYKIIIQP